MNCPHCNTPLPEGAERDAARWAALHFLHPMDIATACMGAKSSTEFVNQLAERADAFIAKARATMKESPMNVERS